jgi:hypothetical protein
MQRSKKVIGTIGCLLAIIMTSACSVEKLTDSLRCDSEGLFSKALVDKTFYQEALNAYAQEQSVENCQELRTSGFDYIQAVQKYIDCSDEGDEAVRRELKEAEKALADLDC